MTVYIDVLIIMNIYITYFTLRAAGKLLHTAIPFRRIAAASVFGGLTSLAALIEVNFFASLAVKTILTLLTVLVSFGFGSVKKLLIRSFVTAAVGMLICGAAIMIHELTGSDIVFPVNGYVYLNISALVLVISSAVIYGALALLRRIFDSPEADAPVKLTITHRGRTAEISAISDSGNYLTDFLTGRPVIVCRGGAADNVLPENLERCLSGSTEDMSGIRLIPMNTASGSSLAAAFRPERITAELHGEKKELDALVAVTKGSFEGESFDAVIPAKLLK